MKLKIITTCDSQTHSGFIRMKESVAKHGWEIEVIDAPFQFGKQMQVIQKWLNNYEADQIKSKIKLPRKSNQAFS